MPANFLTAAQTAISHDGGQTWQLTNHPPLNYAIFCISYLSNTTGVGGGSKKFVARQTKRSPTDYTQYVVATADIGGAAWSPDEGTTWNFLPGVSGYWAVAFANPQNGWMVGGSGSILKVSFP